MWQINFIRIRMYKRIYKDNERRIETNCARAEQAKKK